MAETRVVRGRWWLAEKTSDDGVPGSLTLSDEEIRLDLEGTVLTDNTLKAKVLDFSNPSPIDRILGETVERDAVTLEECNLAAYSPHMVRDRGTTYREAYRPRMVCVGAWFEADEPLAFDRVLVKLTSLHAWTAVSGFRREDTIYSHTGGKARVKYRPPPELTATLGDGTQLKLSFPLKKKREGTLYASALKLVQNTRFSFEFPVPYEVEEIQRRVYTLRNFLTLAVREAVKVTWLYGYRKPVTTDPLDEGREVEIIYRHIEDPGARELPDHHDMVFVLTDVANDFERHMVQWFDRAPELGRVLDLYFSTLHAGFMYLDTRFMNFAAGIEGYHRRRIDRQLYDDATFAGYKEQILTGLTGRSRQIARGALKYANEPSLEDRISDVLKMLGECGESIVSAANLTRREFAARAARIRNIHAHNLKREEPAHLELVLHTYGLEAIATACLLCEVGFEPARIDRLLREARVYRFISQVRERWDIQSGSTTGT